MENNKIYIGDSLETLRGFPDNFFDITVTSPPYNKQGMSGALVAEVKYKGSSDTRNENGYRAEQIDVLNELYRVTKPGGHVFYNHKLRWLNGEMAHPLEWILATIWIRNIRQEIIWDRGIAANIRGWRFWQVEERIFWMQKGIAVGEELQSKHAKMSSIWRIRPEMRSEHPAPFPISLPTRCICSVQGDRIGLNILDPYAGSGTTLVAAKILKHNYVGIDCSPEYIQLAQARLASFFNTDHNSDYNNVVDETKLHVVEKSYAERKKLKFSKVE